jgi:hypothetical protein
MTHPSARQPASLNGGGAGPLGRADRLRPRQPDRDRRLGRRDLGALGRRRRTPAPCASADRMVVRNSGRVPRDPVSTRARLGAPRRVEPGGHRLDSGDGSRDVRARDGKSRTGPALGNEVLLAEGRVTRIDGLLRTGFKMSVCGRGARSEREWLPARSLMLSICKSRETAPRSPLARSALCARQGSPQVCLSGQPHRRPINQPLSPTSRPQAIRDPRTPRSS